mmetsp:Transcript_74150/g.208985  ORF Transcript_74150/g.208985 Transcript_74150/m.208985 type:complete len:339 (-) Transcript_74150:37-1053(-)
MVLHCLRDDFHSFLDRDQYYLNARLFDSIGLPPGSPPRNRNIIGHQVFSVMNEGVGRGAIFNHRDPLNDEEDYDYTVRTVERLRRVLACGERKLFVMLNLNKQLWKEAEVREVFEELRGRTQNFDFLAVDCARNAGPAAGGHLAEEIGCCEHRVAAGGICRLLMYRLPCVGDNTGSYFREDVDTERIRRLLIEPYTFSLADDPLPQDWQRGAAPPPTPQRSLAGTSDGASCEAQEAARVGGTGRWSTSRRPPTATIDAADAAECTSAFASAPAPEDRNGTGAALVAGESAKKAAAFTTTAPQTPLSPSVSPDSRQGAGVVAAGAAGHARRWTSKRAVA